MKTRRLATILTSAYLSAMLASSVTPIRSDATLAAAIDPSAAQKALQNAIDATGWMGASVVDAPAPMAVAKIAPNNPAPKADPVMTDELLARLLKFTLSSKPTSSIDAKSCAMFGLCDGTSNLPMKFLESDLGNHYFGFPAKGDDSKNIIIAVRNGNDVTIYLTDKTLTIRDACVSGPNGPIRISNQKAAEGFKAELALFAKEAGDLPPSSAPVAGNS